MSKVNYRKIIAVLIVLAIIGYIFLSTRPKPPVATLSDSQQMLLVTAADSNTTPAKLQRYERSNNQQEWVSVGQPIDVVVGKHGMGWHALQSPPSNVAVKQEGDGRTPAGIFSLGTAFGFSDKPGFAMKLNYLPVTDSTVCVDDGKSDFYNTIIDSQKEHKSSWSSGEEMRKKVPSYFWGVVVNYNYPHPVVGAGSCIFMHVWKGPTEGTSGCVAMTEADIKQVLAWLDASKNPRLVVIPLDQYENFKGKWKLPERK